MISLITIIISSIFIISLAVVAFIFYRKIPTLIALPNSEVEKITDHKIFDKTKERLENVVVFFEKKVWMQKALSWLKCMILKIEVKIDHWLHHIRKEAQNKK